MTPRRRSTLTLVVAAVLAVLCLALAGILALALVTASSLPARSMAPIPSASPTYDPYPWYFAHSPIGVRHLTRSQAVARAQAGCGQTFAPGTVDAVLSQAYEGICQ